MNEWQRNEFRKATGFLLQFARDNHVASPRDGVLHTAVHDGDVAVQTNAVRLTMALEPFFGVHLVGTDDGANLIVKNFCCSARQGSETSVFESLQVLTQRFSVAVCAFGDFQCGEPMHVHIGNSRLHRLGDVDVIVAIKVGVNTALQCHLSGTKSSSFHCAVGNVIKSEQVRRTAKVERHRTFGESAELALVRTHVGVVDVAVVHPGNCVAHGFEAKFVGIVGDVADFWSTCTEQVDKFLFAKFLTIAMSFDDLSNTTTSERTWMRHQCHGLGVGT